jgi:hypothetical protein
MAGGLFRRSMHCDGTGRRLTNSAEVRDRHPTRAQEAGPRDERSQGFHGTRPSTT